LRERDDLRRERDALIQEKINTNSDVEQLRLDVERWKAASEKAEWTIDHQSESIAELRREAQSWKGQFLRVEEERSRLSARMEDMVAEQLQVRNMIFMITRC